MSKYLTIFLVFFVFLITGDFCSAKDFTPADIKKNLPKMLGATSVGREYYITFLPSMEESGGDNGIKIYVSSSVKTKVTCEVVAKQIFLTDTTIPNDVIVFSLTPSEAQAYRKTDRDPPNKDSIYKGVAVHVYADDPIICYGLTRFNYTSDGFLAIPVPALGKEYISSSWEDQGDETIQWLTAYTSVVGAYDKTNVHFTFGGNTNSKSVSGLKPGESSNWTINTGDVLLIGAIGSHSDISGSKIIASKPVGVISGNQCPNIPTNCGCCDFITEMELPTNSWGKSYHVTNFKDRKKNSFIRIYSKEPNTKIYRDGVEVGFIKESGGLKDVGWLSMRAGEGLPMPYLISGDKPINITQYNSGSGDDGMVGDPFQLVLTPVEQYQKEITFNTPGIKKGFAFPRNFINICYQSNEENKIPDDLEFAEVLNGQVIWKRLNSYDSIPGKEFALPVMGKRYFSKTIQLKNDGIFKIRANLSFVVYAYGYSSYDSYGFPTSVSFKDLTINDTIPPSPRWFMDCKGTVNPDKKTTVKDMPEDMLSRSNLSLIFMHSDSSYNYKPYIDPFVPGEDRETKWSLEVIDRSKEARAVMTFTDRAGNDTTLILNYYPGKLNLTIRPDSTNWGVLPINTIASKTFWVINESTSSAAKVEFLNLKNNDKGFEIKNMNGTKLIMPFIINQMDSVPFIVIYTSGKKCNVIDSIGVGDSCKFEYKAQVEATGPKLTIRPKLKDWGIVPNDSIVSNIFWLINESDNIPVTADLLTLINKNQGFEISDVKGDSFQLPVQVQPNDSIPFKVTFTAKTGGNFIDSIGVGDSCEVKNLVHIEATSYKMSVKIKPNNMTWGKLPKDTVVSKVFSLVNESNISSAIIKSINFQKYDQGFVFKSMNNTTLKLPLKLNPLDSIPFKVIYTASNSGQSIDSLGIQVDSFATIYMSHLEATGDFVGVADDLADGIFLNVYPNPSEGNAVIEFRCPLNSNISLALYNMLGEKYDLPIVSGISRVNLRSNELPSGIYNLVLRAGTNHITKQLIIQK